MIFFYLVLVFYGNLRYYNVQVVESGEMWWKSGAKG